MNWQTHVPNIFDIDLNVTFIRFLHFFSVYYTSTRVVIRVIITKINDNRFYDTSIYTYSFSILTTCSSAFVHTSFVIFLKAAYVSSLTSFNRKVVLFLATKPLTCAHINSIGLSSVSNGGYNKNPRSTLNLIR